MIKNSFFILFILGLGLNAHAQRIKDLPVLNHFSVNTDSISIEGYLADQRKEINTDDRKMYSWFAGGKINNSQGDYKDRLLDGVYTSSYINKRLKEKGVYKNGLKKGNWLKWDEAGKLKVKRHFIKGWLSGFRTVYDSTGVPKSRVHYKRNQMNGKAQDYQAGHWVKTGNYKNGQLVPAKESFIKKKFNAIFKKRPKKDKR